MSGRPARTTVGVLTSTALLVGAATSTVVLAFDLDDPGLSDPQGNGYLAWSPRQPVPPAVPDPWLRGAVSAGLVLAGGAVLVATVAGAAGPAGPARPHPGETVSPPPPRAAP